MRLVAQTSIVLTAKPLTPPRAMTQNENGSVGQVGQGLGGQRHGFGDHCGIRTTIQLVTKEICKDKIKAETCPVWGSFAQTIWWARLASLGQKKWRGCFFILKLVCRVVVGARFWNCFLFFWNGS
jgi:hypothetical protein